ncbi:energy-coupling factor ABC transporter ATP-binding protein [Zhihengliuella flava]|uniref:Biotin transport system ATP-binding protein n=1 Tax=Zhihengliuella flava TaxID=1285193 RepID=A0A931DFE0_9MICC|nr:ABC transporter ATP-binding protein [Zhihengliuella flava]MBG6085763.1 biotin transport system ATP-binding protein [Zhihengliuella flava]
MTEIGVEFDAATVSVEDHAGGEAARRTLLAPTTLSLTEPRIAVVGANGSGKSTLLKLINGLVRPTAGEVRVGGYSTTAEPKRVRRLTGFLFTDPAAQLVMPVVVEDVELSLKATVKDRQERRSRALATLSALGISHLAERSVFDLSGGERQLVALASVLAAGQRLLVADEPTTLLDLRNQALLERTLDTLEQQVIYATHDLDFAARADRVLVVDSGAVVYDGDAGAGLEAYRALALGAAS